MSLLSELKGISSASYNNFDIIKGLPGTGKTTLGATYPKPMLYLQIGEDGGGSVLKKYSDDEVKTFQLKGDNPKDPKGKSIVAKLKEWLDEIIANPNHGFKTIFIDPYSSVEEGYVNYLTEKKGKNLNFDEWMLISKQMLELRDKLVNISNRGNEIVVIATHVKSVDISDTATGESSMQIIPKMTINNGNNLLEQASNVMYSARRVVEELDGTRYVKFLTYIGAHPNMNTKFRTRTGETLATPGIYIENCSYEDIERLKNGEKREQTVTVVENKSNPFDKAEESSDW